MSHYFSAQFVSLSSDRESQLIRHNTRLWFACPYRPLPYGKCVGAVVGLNPGSAIGQNNEHTESIGICDPTMEWNWDVGAEFRISIKKPELRGLRP